jgi:hypothetical protein
MAYFLFVDESGIDRRDSPYEVLAGISVNESRVWSLICAIQQAENSFFGGRMTQGALELKAKKLLKKKTFRFAQALPPIPAAERTLLVKELIRENQSAKNKGEPPNLSRRHFAALGQAKIAFCQEVFEIAGHHQVKTFASIVPGKRQGPLGVFCVKITHTCSSDSFTTWNQRTSNGQVSGFPNHSGALLCPQ